MPIAAILEIVLAVLSSRSATPSQTDDSTVTNKTVWLNKTAPHNNSESLNTTQIPLVSLSATIQPGLITNNAIVVPLGAFFVGLRFYSRWKRGLGFGMDDWMIVIALCELFVLLALSLDLIHQGLGRHIGSLSKAELKQFAKLLLAFQCTYITILTTVKIAVLMLYARIFPIRKVRIAAYILGTISLSWGISMICISLFRCSPIPKAWITSLPGYCINFEDAILGNAVPNIVTDIAILTLPMPLLWQLHTGVVQKFMLSGVFLLGSFVVFTSIYRFTTLLKYNPSDVTWTLAQVFAWSVTECSAGIISACLPTLGPLINLPSITSKFKRAAANFGTNSCGPVRKLVASLANSSKSFRSKTITSKYGDGDEEERNGERQIDICMDSEVRRGRRGKEANIDDEDVGEGIKRPAFFKLPSRRGEAGFGLGGQGAKRSSKDQERGEMR